MADLFKRLLVANRGEIAVRIIRAARELGLETVAVHSEADRDSLAVRMADVAVAIGPPPAAKSYLNVDALIRAALDSGAQAVHPGYGFLSENAKFAEAVERAGLVFVGPTPETIRIMGNKSLARETAAKAGVSTVPGSDGVVETIDEAVAAGAKIGYPVMIKASAGGGGRGIRVARDAEELRKQMSLAQTEAGDKRFSKRDRLRLCPKPRANACANRPCAWPGLLATAALAHWSIFTTMTRMSFSSSR